MRLSPYNPTQSRAVSPHLLSVPTAYLQNVLISPMTVLKLCLGWRLTSLPLLGAPSDHHSTSCLLEFVTSESLSQFLLSMKKMNHEHLLCKPSELINFPKPSLPVCEVAVISFGDEVR